MTREGRLVMQEIRMSEGSGGGVITERSEKRLADVVRTERRRAADRWREVDEFSRWGNEVDAERARVAAAAHERVVNLIMGAVPELPS